MPPMTDAARLVKVQGLLTKRREVMAQLLALDAEIEAIAGGKLGIAERMKAFEAHWRVIWECRYHHDYVFAWKTDAPMLKALLQKFADADLHARATAYLENGEAFYVQQRHPFRLFGSKINCFVPTSSASAAPRPTDCDHRPPCQTVVEHTKRMVGDMKLDGWQ